MAAMNCPYEYVFPKVSSQVQTVVDLVPGNLAIAIISLHYLHVMYRVIVQTFVSITYMLCTQSSCKCLSSLLTHNVQSHCANFCLHYLHIMRAVIMQTFVSITYTLCPESSCKRLSPLLTRYACSHHANVCFHYLHVMHAVIMQTFVSIPYSLCTQSSCKLLSPLPTRYVHSRVNNTQTFVSTQFGIRVKFT